MSESVAPYHEGSAWLRERIAQITAEAAGRRAYGVVVVAPLGGVVTEPGTPADRTCDRCNTCVPELAPFKIVMLRPERWLIIVGGLCAPCADREVSS